MSRGQSQRRTDFRKRAFERCNSKGKARDTIDIDVDISANFIIIDASEPSKWTSLDASTSGRHKTHVYSNIIYIDDDDDDDDDDCVECDNSHDCFEAGTRDSDVASSSRCQPLHNRGRHFISKSSKCLNACSTKISSLNHQNSSTSSESDDSDCYIEEDFLGNIRQQWERASLRKRMFENTTKGPYGFHNPARCNFNSQNNVNVDKTAGLGVCNTNRSHDNGKFNQSPCTNGAASGGAALKSDGNNQHTNLSETTLRQCANSQSQVDVNPSDDLTGVQNYIIGDREMLKKTDAYRRAEEEEWASRQRELQIQAEAARRMRKRIKAETQRLLETERRQKQRLDEVREAQRKDEETLNLKDQLRVEVRRELDKLEANCRDMASLLHGLGIDTGGGLCPSSSQVRAAYKQSLLRFHPDRASRTDIRQQIEAEEKFKLISRAKEKFML